MLDSDGQSAANPVRAAAERGVTPIMGKNNPLGRRARNAAKRLREYGYLYEAKTMLECIEKLEGSTEHFLGEQHKKYLDGWKACEAAQKERVVTEAAYEAGREEVTHLSPLGDSGLTPCCLRSPFELPRTDRMTNDVALQNCGHAYAEVCEAALAAMDET